jgi:hypothetical protein
MEQQIYEIAEETPQKYFKRNTARIGAAITL